MATKSAIQDAGASTAAAQRRRGFRRLPWLVVLMVLVAAACGGADDATSGAAEPTTTAPTSGAVESPSAEPGPVPTDDPVSPSPATSPTMSAAGAGLTGEDVSGPPAGTTFGVVGVAADDVLNVREVPGVGGEVFGELQPLADGITATGRARLVDDSVWFQIDGDAADDGWVNARYLAVLGETTDITSEFAERPAAETMLQLADMVAALRAPPDGEGDGPTVVVSDGPSVGDLGEVAIDVLGFADDAIRGERLHLFAEPDMGGEGFTLRTVERTLLCARGVSDGLCS